MPGYSTRITHVSLSANSSTSVRFGYASNKRSIANAPGEDIPEHVAEHPVDPLIRPRQLHRAPVTFMTLMIVLLHDLPFGVEALVNLDGVARQHARAAG